jgi:uncharacterized protein YjiS (DUF1127 family)
MERKMSDVIRTHMMRGSLSDWAAFALGVPIGLVRVLIKRFQERRELNYLLSLPDYELRDIGLQRGDIQREAIKPIWRA